METSQILKEIKEAILAIEPEAEIILFGSEARGTAGKHSDIDLLILLNGQRTFNEKMNITGAVYDIELKYSKVICPFVLSHKDWEEQSKRTPFYYEVQEEGIKI
jgi:uncharacterized protein